MKQRRRPAFSDHMRVANIKHLAAPEPATIKDNLFFNVMPLIKQLGIPLRKPSDEFHTLLLVRPVFESLILPYLSQQPALRFSVMRQIMQQLYPAMDKMASFDGHSELDVNVPFKTGIGRRIAIFKRVSWDTVLLHSLTRDKSHPNQQNVITLPSPPKLTAAA